MAKKVSKKTTKKTSGASKKASASKRSTKKTPAPAKRADKKTTTKKTPEKKTPEKKTPAKTSSRSTAAKKPAKTTTKKAVKKTTKKPAKKTGPAAEPKAAAESSSAPRTAPTKEREPAAKPAAAASTPTKQRTRKPAASSKQAAASSSAPKAEPGKQAGDAAPRFRSHFGGNRGSGAEAAAKLAQAAGITGIRAEEAKLKREAERYEQLTETPFADSELAEFRETLVVKRRQIVGDMTSMETEALGSTSGSLSRLPQHMADAGSDVADQSLNLDLVASQRKLLKELDDALARIEERTYGICELFGKEIGKERLQHTPWARFSIEAARALERNPFLERPDTE